MKAVNTCHQELAKTQDSLLLLQAAVETQASEPNALVVIEQLATEVKDLIETAVNHNDVAKTLIRKCQNQIDAK